MRRPSNIGVRRANQAGIGIMSSSRHTWTEDPRFVLEVRLSYSVRRYAVRLVDRLGAGWVGVCTSLSIRTRSDTVHAQ